MNNVRRPINCDGLQITSIVLAATVGVVTETNAEKAIEELKAYEVSLAYGHAFDRPAKPG